jgi:predicted helicase
VVFNDRPATMRPMLQGDNIALLTNRRIRTEKHAHFFVTDTICMAEMLSSADNCNIYPLFSAGEDEALFKTTRHSTISSPAMEAMQNGTDRLSPRDIFHWVYAIVHSPTYRSRYQAQLKADHPRVPLPPASCGFTSKLCELGAELVDLHLHRIRTATHHVTTAVGVGKFQVEKVSYSDETVWIDKAKTRGFHGVSEPVWNFHVGGYRVSEKWLKDRQAKGGKNSRPGRVLTDEDIEHYQRIIVALSETIHIMAEIDEVIEEHGGWPGAFQTGDAIAECQEEGSLIAAEPQEEYRSQLPRGEKN